MNAQQYKELTVRLQALAGCANAQQQQVLLHYMVSAFATSDYNELAETMLQHGYSKLYTEMRMRAAESNACDSVATYEEYLYVNEEDEVYDF